MGYISFSCILLFFLLIAGYKSITEKTIALHQFGKEEVLPIRALLAIGIILCHTGAPVFREWGGVIVSIFFFITGFGLMKSYSLKGNEYLNGFLKKRLFPIIIPFIIASLLWQLYVVLVLPEYTANHIHMLAEGDPCVILPTSWFIYAILLCYVIFYIVARISISEKKLLIGFLIAIIVESLFAIYLYKRVGFGSQWFISNSGLLEGAFVATFEKKIREYIDKYRVLITILLTICLLVSCFLAISTKIGLIVFNALVPIELLAIVYILGSVNCKTLDFLGSFSLELYLVQGCIITVLKDMEANSIVLTSFSISVSIIFAYLLFRIKTYILSWFKNLNLKNLN